VTSFICGVDVSAAWLDAWAEGEFCRVENTLAGIEVLRDFCRRQGVELVAMEATGGYERLAFGRLWAEGLACAVVNPRAVRQFAEAMGHLEKTDRIDAAVIAGYARAKRIVAQPPAGEVQRKLGALVTRLRQLTALRTMQKNQRRLVEDAEALGSIDEMLALIGRQIRGFEAGIISLIAGDPLWARLDAAFRSIKGVADRTVARVLAELPEIGTLPNKAAAKLTGVAPLARDSGKRAGKRAIRGGRSGVRSVLFVVAEVVRRHDPDFAAFHRRLTSAGKAKKVIRIALAHKLLVRLNAKARDVRSQIQCTA
jgi:transposase